MPNIKYLNKENTNPFMTTSCQIVFSTKFTPSEIHDMLFNDDALKDIHCIRDSINQIMKNRSMNWLIKPKRDMIK